MGADGTNEIEAKLVAASPRAMEIVEALSSCATLGGVPLGPGREQRIHDIYLDTPSNALRSWGGAMRIRDRNGERLITIKGPAGERTGASISRPELELRLTQANVQQALDWTRDRMDDDGDLPRTPSVATGTPSIEGFAPFHDRRTARLTRVVGSGEAELAIDRATYRVGGREVTLVEIEIESLAPEGVALVERIAAELGEREGLRPWDHSKLAVGLALARLDAAGRLGGSVDEAGVLNETGLELIDADLRA